MSFRDRVNLLRLSKRVFKTPNATTPAATSGDAAAQVTVITAQRPEPIIESPPATIVENSVVSPKPDPQPSPYEGRAYSPALLKASFLQIDPALLTDQGRLKGQQHQKPSHKIEMSHTCSKTENNATPVRVVEQISEGTFVRRKTFFETLAAQNQT